MVDSRSLAQLSDSSGLSFQRSFFHFVFGLFVFLVPRCRLYCVLEVFIQFGPFFWHFFPMPYGSVIELAWRLFPRLGLFFLLELGEPEFSQATWQTGR